MSLIDLSKVIPQGKSTVLTEGYAKKEAAAEVLRTSDNDIYFNDAKIEEASDLVPTSQGLEIRMTIGASDPKHQTLLLPWPVFDGRDLIFEVGDVDSVKGDLEKGVPRTFWRDSENETGEKIRVTLVPSIDTEEEARKRIEHSPWSDQWNSERIASAYSGEGFSKKDRDLIAKLRLYDWLQALGQDTARAEDPGNLVSEALQNKLAGLLLHITLEEKYPSPSQIVIGQKKTQALDALLGPDGVPEWKAQFNGLETPAAQKKFLYARMLELVYDADPTTIKDRRKRLSQVPFQKPTATAQEIVENLREAKAMHNGVAVLRPQPPKTVVLHAGKREVGTLRIVSDMHWGDNTTDIPGVRDQINRYHAHQLGLFFESKPKSLMLENLTERPDVSFVHGYQTLLSSTPEAFAVALGEGQVGEDFLAKMASALWYAGLHRDVRLYPSISKTEKFFYTGDHAPPGSGGIRQWLAVREAMKFFSENPGATLTMPYGHGHEWKSTDFVLTHLDPNNLPYIEQVYWPGMIYAWPSMADHALAKQFSENPELRMEFLSLIDLLLPNSFKHLADATENEQLRAIEITFRDPEKIWSEALRDTFFKKHTTFPSVLDEIDKKFADSVRSK